MAQGSAGETLEVQFVPIGGRGRPRVVAVVSTVLLYLLTSLLGASFAAPLTALLVRRRSDGAELASGPVEDMTRDWLRDMMRKDLDRLSEAAFLDRWGDPSRWEWMYRHWPASTNGTNRQQI